MLTHIFQGEENRKIATRWTKNFHCKVNALTDWFTDWCVSEKITLNRYFQFTRGRSWWRLQLFGDFRQIDKNFYFTPS